MSLIKLIAFDYDGTLIPLVEAHYEALNQAIAKIAGSQFIISKEEQNTIFNGLSTITKLNKLSNLKKLDSSLIYKINLLKQELTIKYIEDNIIEDKRLFNDLQKLKQEGYALYCVSNAMFKTIEAGLKQLKIFDLFDKIIGNDNVERQKPYPDIYLHTFIDAKVDPKEVLIVEDSKHGKESAYRSGAYVCSVKNENYTTYNIIKSHIKFYNNQNIVPHIDYSLNVIIPMGGNGKRFKDKGYILPKPLIDVNGKTMIQRAFDSLNIKANYIFIVNKKQCDDYNLKIILKLIDPNCTIIEESGELLGAANALLLAEEYIYNDNPVLIANCDQLLDWDSRQFLHDAIDRKCAGSILTFEDNSKNIKWSFAKTDEFGNVIEVAEKKPISNLAATGIYYFNAGYELIDYTKQMISKNIRTNNEFYICPIYNEYIKDNKKIITYNCNKMIGIGTAEDLENYLKSM